MGEIFLEGRRKGGGGETTRKKQLKTLLQGSLCVIEEYITIFLSELLFSSLFEKVVKMVHQEKFSIFYSTSEPLLQNNVFCTASML